MFDEDGNVWHICNYVLSIAYDTCELATRFLDDYINGDKYFKVKKEAHNLVRTRCQIALAKDMLNKLEAMDAIVKACAKKYR